MLRRKKETRVLSIPGPYLVGVMACNNLGKLHKEGTISLSACSPPDHSSSISTTCSSSLQPDYLLHLQPDPANLHFSHPLFYRRLVLTDTQDYQIYLLASLVPPLKVAYLVSCSLVRITYGPNRLFLSYCSRLLNPSRRHNHFYFVYSAN
ncbi:hypothetical protein EDC04DRAFT_2678732 [Pisolithus marmoratus]|nr:hypothetical protein EDC04DRAFT_2678732 [Pisolithus marmoratus]